jgi:hypothetical protein
MESNGCVCKAGYQGRFCEIAPQTPILASVSQPIVHLMSKTHFTCEELNCANDGKCIPDVSVGYQCECLVGFGGTFCEQCKDLFLIFD